MAAEVDPIDFDPLTEEGREDLNTIADEEYDSLIPRENETGESWNQRIYNRFKTGTNYIKSRLTDLFKTRNPERAVPEYMELHDLDNEGSSSTDRLRVSTLLTKYPDLDENLIEITLDEKGKQQISFFSARKNIGWTKPERLYNEDKTVRKSVDNKIKSGKYNQISLQLQEIDARNSNLLEEEQRNTEQINRNNEEISTANQERRRTLDRQNEELSERNSEINETIAENNLEVEHLEERMSLRDRVKHIFKKYGLTVASVALAVGTTIGVIVSQLRAGLTSLAKGVGKGLKTIGKKLGEILPGMIGAIASFIFKTAGEVVSYVAEHAWLLIVAVVVYFIEKMKK